MLARPRREQSVIVALERSPVVTLLGPRQSGKTTLARSIWEKLGGTYLDLDLRSDQARLSNPESFLGSLRGLVVLDEVQRDPELFQLLRPLADRKDRPAKFLLLGSASPDIVKGASETLAGRTEFVDMSGFDLEEVGSLKFEKLWFRGGFPRSFLAGSDEASGSWLEGFTRTFLERDLPQLGYYMGPAVIRRLWTMIASVHGQPVNFSALGRSMGLNYKTIQQYVDILEGAFMIRLLPPWFSNTKKRLVKSPKIFIRDSGVLHNLLQIDSLYTLKGHAIAGASWEGFAMEQFFSIFGYRNCYFWCTHQDAEIDLLAVRAGKHYGLEIKLAETPRITRSMRIAMKELDLEHLWVIYPGSESFQLDSDITAWPLSKMLSLPI